MKDKEYYALCFKVINEQMKDSKGEVLKKLNYRRNYYLRKFKECINKEVLK